MPTATRTFRIFVSSTFEDLKAERNALAAPGGPFEELTKVCQRYGARFQAVDLRWGVREEAGYDQRTIEICLGEIERCQQTKIKPNFIVLLGDRYGWRPLPARIDAAEFQAVRDRIANASDRNVVDEWYRLDENAVPSEYLLKPRIGEFQDKDRWGEVEAPMHKALRVAARAAGLSRDALIKYDASATHQEILQGLGKTVEDREHVFAFFCKPSGPNEEPDLGELKQFLREQLRGNVFEPRDSVELCDRVRENLDRVIQAAAEGFKSRPALDLEVEAHDTFARDRARNFMGRADVLGAINDYIKGPDRRPMVVHGASGSGKSAVIARVSEAALDHPVNAVIIRRFIGATPESSSGITVLRSLCQQIGQRYGVTEEIPLEFHSVVRTFAGRLALATAEQPLVLFIDALDQIAGSDPAAAATWLMPQLPPHCRVVVSATEVARSLERARIFPLQALPAKDAEAVLTLWLHDAERKLQDRQREKLLAYYDRCGLPLYLKLAFEEARRWRSFDEPEVCVLGDGLAGIIDVLFARLSSGADHGKVLVNRSLGYLAAARYGLTEDEMLDVLTRDEDVWQEFDAAKRHDPPERRLPVIVWSRLYLDLEPYLTERTVPGGTTVSFYHRQLAERVGTTAFHHKGLAEFFAGQSHWLGANIPNQRKITELVRQQVGAGLPEDAAEVLTDLDFVSAKCAADLVFDLEEDYRLAITALPEAQAEIKEEERRAAEVARWTKTLIECAEQQRLPKPEEILKSVEPWSHERIAAESKRVVENPTRLDRLKAFAGFVEQELYPLDEFGKRPGFVLQHAFNSAPRGPVHASAAQQVETAGAPLLLRRWPHNVAYSPMPALLRTLEGHSDKITSVSVTPDGRRVVSGSEDHTLRVWNLETGESTMLRGHTNWVSSVSMTADGRRAVSGSYDNTLRVWNLETGESTAPLQGHTDWVKSVSVAADGRRVVSASGDNTLRVWNLETGESTVLQGHTGLVGSVSMTADGRRVVSGSWDKTLRVWNLETGESTVLRGHTGGVESVSVTADGRRAVSGSGDRTVRVWDLQTGESRVLQGHTGTARSVGVTADGRRAVSGSLDNTLRVWDLETGESPVPQGLTGSFPSVSVTADGRRVVSGADKTLRVWNLETGESPLLQGHTDQVMSVSVTADGRRAVSGSWDDTLRAWNLDTGESTVLQGHTSSVTSVSVTADGRRAVSGSKDWTLVLWNLETCESTVLHGDIGANTASVTADGRLAVSGSSDKTLRVWNLDTGESTVLQGHSDAVNSVSVTADGRLAVSGSSDKTLRVWNLETCESNVLQGHTDWVWSVSVTADGRRAVSGSWDDTLRAWNLDTGESTVLQGHTSRVLSVSVTADGRLAVSGSRDSTLRVWNLEAGACLAIARMNAPCTAVAVTGDNRIVAGTEVGEVLFFDARGLDL